MVLRYITLLPPGSGPSVEAIWQSDTILTDRLKEMQNLQSASATFATSNDLVKGVDADAAIP